MDIYLPPNFLVHHSCGESVFSLKCSLSKLNSYLALESEGILYDEPTSGLDPVTSDSITQMICRLRDEIGMTSVLISHDIAESFKAGDKESFRNSTNAVVQQFIHARSVGPIAFH